MTLAIIISILCVFAYIIIELISTPTLAFYTKGLASLSFIMVFGVAIIIKQQFFVPDLFILLGLTFGLLGDLNLALRPLRPKIENEVLIIKGMVLFSLGHLSYLFALLQSNAFYPLAIISGLLAMLLVMFLSHKLHYQMGKTKLYNYAYAFLMFLMVGQVLAMAIFHSFDHHSLLLLLGFSLFGLSDLILSTIYYQNKETKIYISFNLLTYYAAQILIAISVMFLS